MTSEPASHTIPPQSYPLDFGSIRGLVEYRFTLLDAYIDVSGMPTFITAREPVRDKFQELLRDLSNHGLMAKIRRASDKLVISVFPKPRLGRPRKALNVALFLATIGTVAFASFMYVSAVDPRLIPILFSGTSLQAQATILALSILGIVGLHETGHLVAVRYHKMDATLPYFFPAPPPVGTFGAVISLRGPPANRDQLFDLGFSGPLAGFLTTVTVAAFAVLTIPLITEQQTSALLSENLLSTVGWPHIPLLLNLLLDVKTVPAGQVPVLTSIALAVQVGALITFLNLLPVWQLDGGHISRATFGEKGHKYSAVVAFAVLLLSQYWGFALLLLVFMLASRRPLLGVEPLDDVSPLSRSRKALFASTLVMLALSFVII